MCVVDMKLLPHRKCAAVYIIAYMRSVCVYTD